MLTKSAFHCPRWQPSYGWAVLALLLLPWAVEAQPSEELDYQLGQITEMLDKMDRSDSDTERELLANTVIEMTRTVRYEQGFVRASIMLGQVSARSGRDEKALRHYLEAENHARDGNSQVYLPRIYRLMGQLFQHQKLYTSAYKYYAQAHDLLPNDLSLVEQMGDAALAAGKLDTAEAHFKVLIKQFKEDGNNPRLVQTYQKLATTYEVGKDYFKSLYYYLLIESIVERFGEPFERGRLYNNLGKVYVTLGDYRKALNYFRKTEIQCDFAANTAQPCELPEVFYANMGITLHNTGNTKEGLRYLFLAERILQNRKDEAALASLEHIIATVYFSSNDLYNALKHNSTSVELAQRTKQNDVLMRGYKTAADIYQDLYDFEKAFDYYQKYLELLNQARATEQQQQRTLAERSTQLRAAEGEIRFLLAEQEIRDRDLSESRNAQERLELTNRALYAEGREREQQVALLQKQKEVDQATLREQTALALQVQSQLRLAAQALDAQKKNAIINELQGRKLIDEAERRTREQEVSLLQKQQEIEQAKLQAKLQEKANFERNTYIVGGLGSISLLVFGFAWYMARRAGKRLKVQNRKIEAQKNQIDAERAKSDLLLLNILPEEIASELKTRGHAAPRLFESATVLFTDFVNFTKLSAQLSPEEIIGELDTCFLAFDEIIDRHGLEKIKTIGDAFMCAGGLPVPNQTHPTDAVSAALDMAAWLNHRNQTNPNAILREMRIGIHTGPVVAGVIGKNKFAYDIWGDAVNLAARLEEQGEAGRVNISATTYEAIKHRFACIHRGILEVHNKGAVEMYFVEGELPA
jgi:adenylate cyclase